MRFRIRIRAALCVVAFLAPSTALAEGIEGWIADDLARQILAGIPADDEAARKRVAVLPFRPGETPVAADAANALNASLLSALIAQSGGRHVFVARDALKALAHDVAETAVSGPIDPVEALLANAKADVLVAGTLRRVRSDVVLSYKAVAIADGAVLASTRPYRLNLRDADRQSATMALDHALTAAARFLAQRVDDMQDLRIGAIRHRSETPGTPFAAYVRDRMAHEFRSLSTGVLSGSALRVGTAAADDDPPGAYRLIGTYWPLGDAVEISLSLRNADGIAVTWREKIRTSSIPAALALGPETSPSPAMRPVGALPWRGAAVRAVRVEGRATVAEAQRLLHALGYDAGPVNGVLGPQTRRAIAVFQRHNGVSVDGRMTRALVANLRQQSR